MTELSRSSPSDCAAEQPAAKTAIDAAQAAGLEIVHGPGGVPLGAVSEADAKAIESGQLARCPQCGERDMDKLVFDDDAESVTCQTCGASFDPLGAAQPTPSDEADDDAWLAKHGLPLTGLGPEPIARRHIEQQLRCCFCGQPCEANDNGCHEACLSDACDALDLSSDPFGDEEGGAE